MFLLLNTLVDEGERCAPSCSHKVRISPQTRQVWFQHGQLLSEQTRRPPFDELHQARYPQLRINADQQMDVIRHDFQFFHLSLALLTQLTDDLFQARFNRPNQDFPPIFRAAKRMVVASIKHVPVALVGFTHWGSIQQQAIYGQEHLFWMSIFPMPLPKQGTPLSSP